MYPAETSGDQTKKNRFGGATLLQSGVRGISTLIDDECNGSKIKCRPLSTYSGSLMIVSETVKMHKLS